MSQVIRQSNLFAAEDWRVLHRAFTEINFNAFDFDSLRAAMVEYIRINFPEDFNDFVESSEFIALIDLLAYLGGNLAFRMDLNTRENFIDSAERRESILRLARLISFQPRRNRTSIGLVKVVRIQTNEDLVDSNGNNLSNIPINWNDVNNPDWFEQFILVLNASLIQPNPFGLPVKQGTVGGITTQLYQFNSIPFSAGNIPFSAQVTGRQAAFEIVNVDFEDGGIFFERDPNPEASIFITNRSDGNGNASPNTGFFFLFKQGTLQFQDFNLVVPIENRTLSINVPNVNETDVFVQQVNDNGEVIRDWNKVPAVVGNNVIFNSIDRNVRNIFSVITREDDQIDARFSDGRFGDVPVGIFRTWYRTSLGETGIIRPQDMEDITISIPYENLAGQEFTLAMTFSLQETVNNAIPAETDEQIRTRAPQVFYTQGRMVNGEDYNVFPLQSTQALKIKAVNRTFSGHSRFIDINDPTAARQDANVFADDGILFQEFENNLVELPLPTSKSSTEIVSTIIQPLLVDSEMNNFFFDQYPKEAPIVHPFTVPGFILWEAATSATFSGTGRFNRDASLGTLGGTPVGGGIQVGVGTGGLPEDFITEGALLNFATAGWSTVNSVTDFGNGFKLSGEGKIRLDQNVLTNDWVKEIIPAFRTTLVTSEIQAIVAELDAKNTFGIRYDHTDRTWKIVVAGDIGDENAAFSLANAGDTSLLNLDDSWLVRVEFSNDKFTFTSRGLRFVFESDKAVRFFFLDRFKTIDQDTGKIARDTTNIFGTNDQPGQADQSALGPDHIWTLERSFFLDDGSVEPRKVQIAFFDDDDDGTPDNPKSFDEIVLRDSAGSLIPETERYVFWEKFLDVDAVERLRPAKNIIAISANNGDILSTLFLDQGDVVFNVNDDKFYEYLIDVVPPVFNIGAIDPTFSEVAEGTFQARIGRNMLDFQWRHFAPEDQRIDPAITNIIDIFVLDSGYDFDLRQWIGTDGEDEDKPVPPTPEQLRLTFNEFEEFKMISDEIIWRPVKYKVLFGRQAEEEVQVKFKVVKVVGTDISDGEIKSQIITAINDFFITENWDFGETFFYTELAAFIHQRLPALIASVVIVPQNEESNFGNLFQVNSDSDEIFISAASVTDIQIIESNTETNLRIGN